MKVLLMQPFEWSLVAEANTVHFGVGSGDHWNEGTTRMIEFYTQLKVFGLIACQVISSVISKRLDTWIKFSRGGEGSRNWVTCKMSYPGMIMIFLMKALIFARLTAASFICIHWNSAEITFRQTRQNTVTIFFSCSVKPFGWLQDEISWSHSQVIIL